MRAGTFITLRRVLLAALLTIAAGDRAHAACNLIPGTTKTFDAALGTTNRPFAAPGESVELALRPCDTASPGFTANAADHIVTLLFTPPNGPHTAVIVATDCATLEARRQTCESQVGSATCIQVDPVTDPQALALVTRDVCDATGTCTPVPHLSFRFPDTDGILLPANDGRGLTGPATIAVTRREDPLPCVLSRSSCADQAGLVACADDFFDVQDPACPAPPNACSGRCPNATFGHFTALPPPNDYKALCTTPGAPCTGSGQELRFVVDQSGNILTPMDWRGILVLQGTLPVPRLLRAIFLPPAPTIRLPLGTRSFTSSFTPEGGLLPPIFEPQADASSDLLTLFGTSDAPYTILRIARRYGRCAGGPSDTLACASFEDCPGGTCLDSCVGGAEAGRCCDARCPDTPSTCPDGTCGSLFDLSQSGLRFVGDVASGPPGATGAGPYVLTPATYAFEAQTPVPLEGLVQTSKLFSFVVSEEVAGSDLNGDGDMTDSVVTLRDRDTGEAQPIGAEPACGIDGSPDGRAVARIEQPPFSFPAVAVEGDVVAFLEPEEGTNDPMTHLGCDMNEDGDVTDVILRVFRLGPTDVTAGSFLGLDVTPPPTEVTAGMNLAIDPLPVVNGRSIAVSHGLVFLRAANAAGECAASVRSSANPRLGSAGRCAVLGLGGDRVALTGPAGGTTGDVCVGPKGRLWIVGNQFVNGTIRLAAGTFFHERSSAEIGTILRNEDLSGETAAAITAATEATALPCTQTFDAWNTAQTVTGTGGLNVVCVRDVTLDHTVVRLQGGASDTFVINVTGRFALRGGGKIVSVGVPARAILYNVIGGGPRVLLSGGTGGVRSRSRLDGTLLAPKRDISLATVLVDGGVVGGRDIDILAGAGVRSPRSAECAATVQVLNATAGTTTNLCPARTLSVADGNAAFLRPESGGDAPGCPPGPDLNGDGDAEDQVVHLSLAGGPAENLQCAASAVTLTTDWLVALVSEAGEGAGGTDLNGDGDRLDDVVEIHRVLDGPGACSAPTWRNLGQAADAVDVSGSLVAFITPEAAQGGADLNRDGAVGDRVLQLYDAATNELTDPALAADDFVLGGSAVTLCGRHQLVAFRTSECAQHGPVVSAGCPTGGTDLNGDGDADDDVLNIWDAELHKLVTDGKPLKPQAVTPCRLAACDPRLPYRVGGSKVKFLTLETDQGGDDLNGDGDATDLILQSFDMCTRRPDGTYVTDPHVTAIGAVDPASGTAGDPLEEENGSEVFVSTAGRCAANGEELIVPGSCRTDTDCPPAATCEPAAFPVVAASVVSTTTTVTVTTVTSTSSLPSTTTTVPSTTTSSAPSTSTSTTASSTTSSTAISSTTSTAPPTTTSSTSASSTTTTTATTTTTSAPSSSTTTTSTSTTTVITASTTTLPGTITLAIAGQFGANTPLVGVGRTVGVIVTLSHPAPPGGLDVTLSSDNPAIATVAPVTVNIPAGEVVTSSSTTGVGAGTTTLRGSAPAFAQGTVDIQVTGNTISLSLGSVTVGKNLQVSRSGVLGAPAPAGNLQVTITSADATRLLLSKTATANGSASITVQANAGSQSIPTFYVQALAGAGSVDVTAVATGYAPQTESVALRPSGFVFYYCAVLGNCDFTTTTFSVPTALSIASAVLDPNTLAVADFQAVRGGLTVNVGVTSGTPAVGTIANNPVVFNPGDSFKSTAAFAASASGTSTVTVDIPAGFDTPSNARTLTATATAPSFTSVPSTLTVGRDLQVQVNVYVDAAPPSARAVTVSLASGVATVSTDGTMGGGSTATLTANPGTTFVGTVFVQGRTLGSTTLTVQATGYNIFSSAVTVQPSGFVFYHCAIFGSCDIATTTFSSSSPLYVASAILDPGTLAFAGFQSVRGGLTVNVPVTSGTPAVGTVVGSPAIFNPTDGLNTTLAFAPSAAGTTVVSVNAPAGFSTPSTARDLTATVTASSFTNVPASLAVGRDLQVQVDVYVDAAPPAPTAVAVSVPGTSVATVSADGAVAGGGTVMLTANPGTTLVGTVFVQGRGPGSTTLSVQAAGFGTASSAITVQPSGFLFYLCAIFGQCDVATTTFSGTSPLYVSSAMLDPGTLAFAAFQAVRGGLTVNVPVTSGTPAAGTIVGSPAVFNPGESLNASLTFAPGGGGTTVLTVGAPAGFSTPSNHRDLTATVTAPSFTSIPASLPVGRDLQVEVAVYVDAAPPAPTSVTVSVPGGATSIATVSTDGTVAGGGTATLTANPGTTFVGTVFVQGRGLGNTTLTVQAPGYNTSSSAVTVQLSGFVFYYCANFASCDFTTTSFSADTALYIVPVMLDPTFLNVQSLQAVRGGLSVNVPVISGTPATGTIVGTPAIFNPGDSGNASTMFAPNAPGTSILTVGVPSGFGTPSNARQLTATVTAPSFTTVPASLPVGRDLQTQLDLYVDAPPPGAIAVTLSVPGGATSIATVSTDATLAGGSTASLTANPGTTFVGTVYVQGRGPGNTTLTVQAAGYTTASSAVAVQPSGFIFYSCLFASCDFTTTTSSGNSPLYLIPAMLDPTFLNFQSQQPVRGGLTVSVAVTSGTPAVGTIVGSPAIFNPGENFNSSVAFAPIAVGRSILSVGVPAGGFSTPSTLRQLTATVR